MGANKNDTIILKANKSYYDNLSQDERNNFEIMSIELSGFDYELDEIHNELKAKTDELGKPYYRAKKKLRHRKHFLREQQNKNKKNETNN